MARMFAMFKRSFLVYLTTVSGLILLAFAGLQIASAETIELKSKGSITGKILAEKHDQIVIDVGYTALVIPRNQIASISKNDAAEPPAKPTTKKAPAVPEPKDPPVSKAGFFSAPTKSAPVRNVRDLVNLLGEAVVQVRTPGGLGSGFIINEIG